MTGTNLKTAKAKVPKMGINSTKLVGTKILISTATIPITRYRISVRAGMGICCHVARLI